MSSRITWDADLRGITPEAEALVKRAAAVSEREALAHPREYVALLGDRVLAHGRDFTDVFKVASVAAGGLKRWVVYVDPLPPGRHASPNSGTAAK